MRNRLTLRKAVAADAPAIAALHVNAWQTAYAELAPPGVLAHFTLERRLAQWQGLLSRDDGPLVLVAEADGTVIGFLSAGASDEPLIAPRAQVRTLYVAPPLTGHGIGRALLAEAARRLAAQGAVGLGLGVLLGNARAIAFYRSLGGREVGQTVNPGPLWRSEEMVFVWDDLAVLANA